MRSAADSTAPGGIPRLYFSRMAASFSGSGEEQSSSLHGLPVTGLASSIPSVSGILALMPFANAVFTASS